MPTEDYEDLAIGIANLMKFGQVKKLWADFYKKIGLWNIGTSRKL